jgi:hypothetical protein
MAVQGGKGALVVFCGCGRQYIKKAKEKDGKWVNRVDEKELHHDRGGCLWRNNVGLRNMPSLCVQFVATVARC